MYNFKSRITDMKKNVKSTSPGGLEMMINFTDTSNNLYTLVSKAKISSSNSKILVH